MNPRRDGKLVDAKVLWRLDVKKNLILHIGMGKTGTSALQDFFWTNRARLEKIGLQLPKYGAVSHANHLLSSHAT